MPIPWRLRFRRYRLHICLFFTALLLFLPKISPLSQPSDFQTPLPVPPVVHHHLRQEEDQTQYLQTQNEQAKPPLPKLPSLPKINSNDQDSNSKNKFVIRPYMHKVPRALPGTQVPDYSDFINIDILGSGSDTTRLNVGASVNRLPPASNLPRKEKFPVSNPYQLPSGSHSNIPSIQAASFYTPTSAQEAERSQRLQTIRNAFLTSWNLYKAHAWGADEIRPVSQLAINPFTAWGASIVDSLDTLQIMGLNSQFREAVNYVDSVDFDTTFRNSIPMFETVIRYLGGLIAGYDMSGQSEPVLLAKAIQLGDNLIGAFDTANRMPRLHFKWQDSDWKYHELSGATSSIAEIGSMSLEFTRLAQLTGNSSYFDAIHRVSVALSQTAKTLRKQYLFPGTVDSSGCLVVPINNEQLPSTDYGDENEAEAAETSASIAASGSATQTPTSSSSTNSGNPPSISTDTASSETPSPTPSTANSSTSSPGSNSVISPSPSNSISTTTYVPSPIVATTTYTPPASKPQTFVQPNPTPNSHNPGPGSTSFYTTIKLGAPSSSPVVIYDTYLSSIVYFTISTDRNGVKVTHTSGSTFTKLIPRTTQYIVMQNNNDNGAAEQLPTPVVYNSPTSKPSPTPSNGFNSVVIQPGHNVIVKQPQDKVAAHDQAAILDSDKVQDAEKLEYLEKSNAGKLRHADYQPKDFMMDEAVEEEIGLAKRAILMPPKEKEMYPDDTFAHKPDNENHLDTLEKRQSSGNVRNIVSLFGGGQSLITGCQSRGIYADDSSTGSHLGIGGGTDSTYEYYVKEYALLNGGSSLYKDLYENTIDAATQNFMFKPMVSGDPDIVFMGGLQYQGNNFWKYDNSMSHLTCFVGGMYALGSKVFNRPGDLDHARRLTDGCVWAYNITATGVMPEYFSVRRCPSAPLSGGSTPSCHFDPSTADQVSQRENQNLLAKLNAQGISTGGSDASTQVVSGSSSSGAYNKPDSFLSISPGYALRPEALESVFYMYRITGEREWQEKGWNMVSSILQLSGIADSSGNIVGYSSVSDVTDNRRQGVRGTTASSLFVDNCESYWYAETLKYAYLIFADTNVASLDTYVFNTEGHPFKRPN